MMQFLLHCLRLSQWFFEGAQIIIPILHENKLRWQLHNLQNSTQPSDHKLSHHQHQIAILCHVNRPLQYTWEHWLIPKQGAKNVNWSLDVGISISYNRVLSISTKLGNKVIDQLKHGNVVCPPSLKVSSFTTAAIDNIDHNPSSNTATSSFHGTAISLF